MGATLAATTLTTTPAHAVGGGQPVPDEYGFVAHVDIGGERVCSGALVDPRWIITASACFATDPQQPTSVPSGDPAWPTTVTFGNLADTRSANINRAGDSQPDPDQADVVELVPHPSRNLVLARLDHAITAWPTLDISTQPSAAGQQIHTAGYGRTSTQWLVTRAHTSTYTVENVSTETLGILGATKDDSICRGDAGGPVFTVNEGYSSLLGINNTSWQHGCYNEQTTHRGATTTRTDDIREWIRGQMLNLTATAQPRMINLDWLPRTGARKYLVYGSTSQDVEFNSANFLGATSKTSFVHGSLFEHEVWYYRVVPVLTDGTHTPPSVVASTKSVGWRGVQLTRYHHPDGAHFTGSTEVKPPQGFVEDGPIGYIVANPGPNTTEVYSCKVGGTFDYFTSAWPDWRCEGQQTVGLLGYIFRTPPDGVTTRPLYRCNAGEDHFDSVKSDCEGKKKEGRLGYVIVSW